jgi:SAM-dependent methyltransferase
MPTSDRTAMSEAPLPPLTPSASLRWDVVSRIVDRLAPTTVLEIGCGQGSAGSRLAAKARYLGVEPDDQSRGVAEQRIRTRGGAVLAGDHTAVPLGQEFDIVCAFEVLEHIEDDGGALAQWVDHVRPGGHLLLSVPAWRERFGPTDEQVGHFRRYDPGDVERLLAGAGLADIEVTLYGWPLGFALESVRNRMARAGEVHASMAERTSSSGRLRQPRDGGLTGRLTAAATWPFQRLQRLRPHHGVGLVALATRSLS